MGSRMFDLMDILGLDQLPDTKTIADMLRNKSWS